MRLRRFSRENSLLTLPSVIEASRATAALLADAAASHSAGRNAVAHGKAKLQFCHALGVFQKFQIDALTSRLL
ncbi:MAG: hypothetical protein JWR68_3179 [Polaromonas sp.]|nr:hypothetical protein [Polaromonas sp.]